MLQSITVKEKNLWSNLFLVSAPLHPPNQFSLHFFQFSVADPGFGQGGGPRNFFRDFADVAKRS